MVRKTKIVATLGPATSSEEKVAGLVRAGIDVARLNFSHGTASTHRDLARWVREAAAAEGRAVSVLQDIQGPRIRVGTFPGGRAELQKGQQVRLLPGNGQASPGELYVDLLDSAEELEPGHRVLIADGLIRLEVEQVGGGITARVLEAGVVGDHKGVAFPDTRLNLPPVTDKDERDIEIGREIEPDWVAASFVASGADVALIRKLTGAPVIAKVERAVAYEELDDILTEADGVMVARGDLGVEMSLDALPLVQKDIIARTNAAARFSITATEMLESMTSSPRPTRAEVTDVANAVLDGTDAVMLSGETAIGKYPVRVVEVMDSICTSVEADADRWQAPVQFLQNQAPFPSAVAQACVSAARSLGLPAIVAFTESGSTARLISKYRPQARIYALTAVPETYRKMALYWGVSPRMLPRFDSTDDMISYAEQLLLADGLVAPGDGVAMVAGVPPNQAASTNLLKLHVVGSTDRGMPGSG